MHDNSVQQSGKATVAIPLPSQKAEPRFVLAPCSGSRSRYPAESGWRQSKVLPTSSSYLQSRTWLHTCEKDPYHRCKSPTPWKQGQLLQGTLGNSVGEEGHLARTHLESSQTAFAYRYAVLCNSVFCRIFGRSRAVSPFLICTAPLFLSCPVTCIVVTRHGETRRITPPAETVFLSEVPSRAT